MLTESTAAVPRRILPAIVVSQFAGTSVWFAANAVMGDLQRQLGLPTAALGWLSSAVQAGFIAGTLVFALLMIADRISPRWVFLGCALLAALANAAVALPGAGIGLLVGSRFATGFFLAGIYPVGMKIASGWYQRGLGGALGFMVGALVLGTAMPHALRAIGASWPWREVVLWLSVFAVVGGFVMLALVPDGPHLARGARVKVRGLAVIWRDPRVRASAFGYFGHMWELYAMLVAVPAIISTYLHTGPTPGVSAMSATVIAMGAFGCVVGGLLALRLGGAPVAATQLAISALCCLASPWMFGAPWWLFAGWLLVWGTTVAGDSPQFSALTAANSPRDVVGSVLTFVNSIGFAISIVTIELSVWAASRYGWPAVLPWLAIGPALGLWSMRPLLQRARAD